MSFDRCFNLTNIWMRVCRLFMCVLGHKIDESINFIFLRALFRCRISLHFLSIICFVYFSFFFLAFFFIDFHQQVYFRSHTYIISNDFETNEIGSGKTLNMNSFFNIVIKLENQYLANFVCSFVCAIKFSDDEGGQKLSFLEFWRSIEFGNLSFGKFEVEIICINDLWWWNSV